MQAKIDLLKEKIATEDSIQIFPFNPNFITDYKGYTLGMSVEEIDRLHAFRAKNKFVNSSEDFQKVTQVSDTLLHTISTYFKFPEWTKKSKQSAVGSKQQYNHNNSPSSEGLGKDYVIVDLNKVTSEELKIVNGIGEKLSARIIKFRDKLGGFLVDEQLYDVYGLDAEVVQRVLKRFKVLNPPEIEKININTASAEMLSKLIYIQKNVALDIVNYRNSKGNINSFTELAKIENFPKEKIDRLALYLSL